MINIPIGPQSFKRDFLNGQGHFNFDLPGGLKTGDAFAPTVTEVLNTGGSGERGDLTFGDPNGLAMSASVSGGGTRLRGHRCRARTTSASTAYTTTVACSPNHASSPSTMPNRPATA